VGDIKKGKDTFNEGNEGKEDEVQTKVNSSSPPTLVKAFEKGLFVDIRSRF